MQDKRPQRLESKSGCCQGSKAAVESPGCIRASITTAPLAVSGGLFVFGGRGEQNKPQRRSRTMHVPLHRNAAQGRLECEGRGGVLGKGQVGWCEASARVDYLRSRRAAGRQSLQLL